jgi:hypothetical protein
LGRRAYTHRRRENGSNLRFRRTCSSSASTCSSPSYTSTIIRDLMTLDDTCKRNGQKEIKYLHDDAAN